MRTSTRRTLTFVILLFVSLTQASPASAAKIESGAYYNLAPWIRFHPEENLWPMSPLTFIDVSKLTWAHDSGCDDEKSWSDPSRSDLGDGDYAHQMKDGNCNHTPTVWKSNKYTAPHEDYVSGSPSGGEGFFLNLPNANRNGGGLQGDEPVVVRAVSGKWVQYWYNFGDSRTDRYARYGHEGDWEHISIRLNASNVPQEVEYAYHHDKCTLSWAQAPKSGGRPIVYIAKRSHGSYPPGAKTKTRSGVTLDFIGAGSWWDARRNLNKVDSYTFYPYGGGWGEVGSNGDTTGPSSPGPWRGTPAFTAATCKFS